MFDSHAHVVDEAFAHDRADIYARAQGVGVAGWLEVGTTLITSREAIALAHQHQQVYATVGVHPDDTAGVTEETWRELQELLAQPKVVAIGEVGLDFYRGGTLEAQLPVLERFLSLARKWQLPIVFHVRDGGLSAHDALLQLLESLPVVERPRGVIHTFSGTLAQAERYLALGLYLSFSGVVTFKNAGMLREVAAATPLDRILIETDCPYLTPEPHRGERNEPAYVVQVAQKIAAIKNIAVAEVGQATLRNAQQLFDIS